MRECVVQLPYHLISTFFTKIKSKDFLNIKTLYILLSFIINFFNNISNS